MEQSPWKTRKNEGCVGGFNFLAWLSWPSHLTFKFLGWVETAKQFCFWISPLFLLNKIPIHIHCAGRKEPVPAAGSISWVISEHPRSYPVIAVPWTYPYPNVAGVATNISWGFLPELYRCGDGFSCGRTPPRRWKREGTRMAHTSQNSVFTFTPLMIQIWHMWSHSNPS